MKVPKNAVYMKQSNRKTIINLIHKKSVSRAEIARKTGLTRAAISLIVDDLISKGIVVEAGVKESASGRKPVLLQLNSDRLYCVGVSIRYGYCMVGITAIDGQVISERRLDFSHLKDADEGIEMIVGNLKELIENHVTDQIILGIGVASPGPIEINSGIILYPPYLEMWHDIHIVDKLKKHFQYSVYLERDAVASALVEKNYGQGQKYRNFILIDVINHGIGSGLVIEDKLYRGYHGLGGEFGHTTIDINGVACRCGNTGCLECYASVTAIIDGIKDDYPDIKTWQDIVIRSKNDKFLVELIKKEAHILGAGILNVMNLLELEAVILSGDVVFEPYLLIDELRRYVNEKSINRSVRSIDVLVSEEDYNQSIVSSATIISEKFFSGEIMVF